MAKASKKSVVVAVVSSDKAVHQYVDISSLILDVEHNRKFGMDESSISAFAEEIKRDGGVHTPIIVYKSTKGKFKVIAGHRRSLAAQKAGLIKIPAMVHEPLTEEQAFLIQAIENEQREEPSFIDRAISMQRAMKDFGWTQTRVAEVFKTYGSDVSKHLGLLKLEPAQQESIHRGEFTFKDAIRLKKATPEAASVVSQAVQQVALMDKTKEEKKKINKAVLDNLAKDPKTGVAKSEDKKTPPINLSGNLPGSEGKEKKPTDISAPETPEKRDSRMSDPQWVGYLNRIIAACGIKGYEVGILFKMLREHAQNPEAKDFEALLNICGQFKSVDNSKK